MFKVLFLSFSLSLAAQAGGSFCAINQYSVDSRSQGLEKPFTATPNSINVMWWNVQYGKTNFKRGRQGQCRTLDHNLQTLMTDQALPDILILGEYSPRRTFSTETKQGLLQHLPYYYFSRDNSDSVGRGIGIFSRIPFEIVSSEPLDWVDPQMSESQKEEYRSYWSKKTIGDRERFFVKTYLNLRFITDQGSFHIVPIHTAMPWNTIRAVKGVTAAVEAVLWGSDNPLIHQVQSLRSFLERDFGKDLSGAPLMVIGDLNLPETFVLKPKALRVLSKDLRDTFSIFNKTPTFPAAAAPESGQFPYSVFGLKIDHAFVNANLKATTSTVIPLEGSDHLPIGVTLAVGNQCGNKDECRSK